MKKIRFILFAGFLLAAFGLFAQPYDMIPAGDPILEDLRFISLEAGTPLLSFTAPLAPHEIEIFLDSIDPSGFSGPALEALARVRKRLEPDARLKASGKNLSMFFNFTSTVEASARSGTDISWYPLYPKIPHFFSVPVRIFFADSVMLYIEPGLSIDPDNYNNFEKFRFNIPFGFDNNDYRIDANIPLRAFIAAGGPWWNFELGRDRLSFGTGLSGNLGPADNPAFYEFMRLSFFSDFFKYSLLVSHSPLRITEKLYPSLPDPRPDLMMSTQRYFYLHRIDFTFFKVLSLGVMEGLMAGNSGLEIRYLNPLVFFHNFYSSYQYDYWEEGKMSHMNGSFLLLELNWNIIKSLSVYGQFAMNEFATPGEAKNNPDQPPNGFGFMGGVQYAHSFDTWGSLFFLECIYTYPYLYMNSTPFASLIHMRSVSDSTSRSLYYYIGYPRDTIAITLGTRFFNRDALTINGELAWLCQGQHAGPQLVWDWEKSPDAFNESTPSGTVQNKFVVSAGASWKFSGFFTISGTLAGIFSQNNNNIPGSDKAGGQASFSASFSY